MPSNSFENEDYKFKKVKILKMNILANYFD